jgi:hypothetical protein
VGCSTLQVLLVYSLCTTQLQLTHGLQLAQGTGGVCQVQVLPDSASAAGVYAFGGLASGGHGLVAWPCSPLHVMSLLV